MKSSKTRLKDLSLKELKIILNGKSYELDIKKEMEIDMDNLESQLIEASYNYTVLCRTRDLLIKKKDLLGREKEEAYSQAWLFYKDTNERWNNDYVSNKANTNSRYKSLCKRYIKALSRANTLISICNAYKDRLDVLRTLNANFRKLNS